MGVLVSYLGFSPYGGTRILPRFFTMWGYSYLHILLISSSIAVSATLKVSDASRNLRFSVGTNPSRKMLIPVQGNNTAQVKRVNISNQLYKVFPWFTVWYWPIRFDFTTVPYGDSGQSSLMLQWNNCNVKPDWSEQTYCPMKMLYTIGCWALDKQGSRWTSPTAPNK